MKNDKTEQYRICKRASYLQVLDVFINAAAISADLFEVGNFAERSACVEYLDAELAYLAHIPGENSDCLKEIATIAARAQTLQSRLENIDKEMFQTVSAAIRSGRFAKDSFRDFLNTYIATSSEENNSATPQYDAVDDFMNGLFACKLPTNTKALEPEMVYYQKTPASVILRLGERISVNKDDVFVDIGSGPGHTAMLFHLLYGTRATGIEIEPAFCAQAVATAAALGLTAVEFKAMDARSADYATGTIFFMFTPFFGQVLEEVLHLLQAQSRCRKIKVIGYGPCSAVLGIQSWLVPLQPVPVNEYQPAFFESRLSKPIVSAGIS